MQVELNQDMSRAGKLKYLLGEVYDHDHIYRFCNPSKKPKFFVRLFPLHATRFYTSNIGKGVKLISNLAQYLLAI